MQLLQETGGIDLVLLDWMMPGLNGLDVCRKLREFSEVPVIFLLGFLMIGLTVLLQPSRRLTGVLRLSLRYPEVKRSRTALLVSMFCAAVPAHQALRLSPAEATRYLSS